MKPHCLCPAVIHRHNTFWATVPFTPLWQHGGYCYTRLPSSGQREEHWDQSEPNPYQDIIYSVLSVQCNIWLEAIFLLNNGLALARNTWRGHSDCSVFFRHFLQERYHCSIGWIACNHILHCIVFCFSCEQFFVPNKGEYHKTSALKCHSYATRKFGLYKWMVSTVSHSQTQFPS